MAWTSDSIALSAQAAHTRSIVQMLCPCCLATHSGFPPAMRFQLTEEWRAVYGRRYRSFSEVNVLRHRFP